MISIVHVINDNMFVGMCIYMYIKLYVLVCRRIRFVTNWHLLAYVVAINWFLVKCSFDCLF